MALVLGWACGNGENDKTMIHSLKKYVCNIRVLMAVFVLAQAAIHITGMDSPSDDYYYFYYPNAVNWLNEGVPYSTPDGKTWNTDGDIGRHGGQPPAYSLLIAALLKTGGGLNAIFWINVLLLVMAIWFSYKIFDEATSHKSIVFVSLWVLILNPAFLFIPKFYNSESLFTSLLVVCFFFLTKALQQQRLSPFLLALLFLFASIFTRSINLYLAPFLLLPFLMYIPSWQKKTAFAGVVVLFMIAVLGVKSNDDSSYLRRTIADGLKRYRGTEMADSLLAAVQPHKGRWETNFVNANTRLLKEQPVDWIRFWLIKSLKVWYGTDSGSQQGILLFFQILHLIAFWLSIVLFLIGRLKSPVVLLFISCVGYTCAVATVNLSIVRYLVPVAPFYIFTTTYLCHRFFTTIFTRKPS